MSLNESFRIRFATLDDVPELLEMPGENEVHTKYLHEVIVSGRQGIIVLEYSDNIEGYLQIRLTNYGIKIDDFNLPEDKYAVKLLSTIESINEGNPIYGYFSKDSNVIDLLGKAGYKKDLETDKGRLKMIKPWKEVSKDKEKEIKYQKKAEKIRKRYEVLQPRTIYREKMLEKNIEKLDEMISGLGEVSEDSRIDEDSFMCPECGKLFDSEKGMKIHKTKVHG